ncbi:HAMP domain-containing sensor histidine kinase [uncultured Pseudodesulfovibrio sp.]|nr:HAMP domain-containing sensor histidine kinase [uncultured Pseudodesulfovibrio sp.]
MLQKKVLKRDAVISKLQSDKQKNKRLMEAQEENRIDTLERLSSYDKRQRIAKNELSTTRTALTDSTRTISSLQDEVDQLYKEIEVKDLVDKIVQHDLRSALIASVSLPESILADSNLTENQKIIVSLIRDNGRQMLETIDSSLTLYRIEEGTYKKAFTTVNLHDVISTVVDRIGETLSSFKQNVSIDCMDAKDQENDTFLVHGDEFLLYSAFMNLLTNAYEASPPGKPVSIILSKNDYCSVTIRNYGEVPESIRDTFFNKMISSGKKFGTGLGTYSAMKMVKAQDGDIELDSSEPGMTTIYVNLPKPQN